MKIHNSKLLFEYMDHADYDLVQGKDSMVQFLKWMKSSLGDQEFESLINSKDALMLAGLFVLFNKQYRGSTLSTEIQIKIFRGLGFSINPKKIFTQCTKTNVERIPVSLGRVFSCICRIVQNSNESGKFVIPPYVSETFAKNDVGLLLGVEYPVLIQKCNAVPAVVEDNTGGFSPTIEWAEGTKYINLSTNSHYRSGQCTLIVPKSVKYIDFEDFKELITPKRDDSCRLLCPTTIAVEIKDKIKFV